MLSPENPQNVIELIQLALTPVFLIVGIGQLLNVVTTRVSRVIDRARTLENKREEGKKSNWKIEKELIALNRRLNLANWSITFLTGAAAMICIDIILLIANGLLIQNLDQAVLAFFILSVLSITGGLVCFFIEVTLATATLKVNLKHQDNKN